MPLLLEHWKPVVGYEGLYEISNTGRVYGLVSASVLRHRGGRKVCSSVCLYKNDKKTQHQIHTLVAQAFLGYQDETSTIVHKDGWLVNNRPSNLERLSEQQVNQKRLAERREYLRLYYHRKKERIKALHVKNKERRKVVRHQGYLRNKEKIRDHNEQRRKKNKDRVNELSRRKWRENPEYAARINNRRLFRYSTCRHFRLRKLAQAVKARAKTNGMPFDPSCFETLIASPPPHCACCGTELDYQNNRSLSKPSYDRICNDLSYVTGNVAIICFRCNTLKRDGSISDFEMIIAYMQRDRALS